MGAYLARRIVLLVPTILGITFVVFMAVRFLPGDAIDALSGDFGAAPKDVREQLKERYQLNGNIPSQYVNWLGELGRGDLGTSIISGRPVSDDLQHRLPVSAELGVIALLLSLAASIPLGMISAVKQNSFWDFVIRSLSIGFISIPSFWFAALALTYGYRWFGWTPPLRYTELWDNPMANIRSVWMPSTILGLSLAGSVMRFTRTMMLETLRQDYVRTARAKGLGPGAVIWTHAWRNAMLPVLTVIGLQVPVVVGGTVILESIFAIPGMGLFLLQSIQSRDYPVVQAIVLVTAVTVVLTNLAVDVFYSIIDPRVRLS